MLQPAASGFYTFYMTCEDECELWLKEANKPTLNDEPDMDNEGILLAKLPKRTGRLKWDEYETSCLCSIQESLPILYLLTASRPG